MTNMFCYQCQETLNNKGCTKAGVCGKTAQVANRQDLLIWVTKGLSEVIENLRKSGIKIEKKINHIVTDNLFVTITNANFDYEDINKKIEKTLNIKELLIEKLEDKENLSDTAKWVSYDLIEWNERQKDLLKITDEENIRSLKDLITFGVKGMAAYLHHANTLGFEDEEIDKFMQLALVTTLRDDLELEELVQLTLKTGEYGVKAMALLDEANRSTYGEPEITKVNIGVKDRPGILISGHDLKDMEMLLEQTKDTGVDVYTHSEMLPANYYPKFKKYDNFVGNYGNAWWKQREEFEAFNGPILMTTNCIVAPKQSYKDRVFTTGVVGFDGCTHIDSDENGNKDFTPLIEMAKKCSSPVEIEKGEIIGGFAHNQVIALADKIVEAVKNGDIEKFVVMAGCDGRHKSREYYTDFAEKLPKKAVILTAGCAKYRYNKLNLGDINGIPRVLDAGQCNDSYSLAIIAMKLQEVFELDDINELPIAYNIAWYEQKAVIVLLALLSLGVKNIHLGPTLPAFLSEDVVNLLVDEFKIAGIDTVDNDLDLFFG